MTGFQVNTLCMLCDLSVIITIIFGPQPSMNFHDEIDSGLKKLDNLFRVQIIRGQKTEDHRC